MANLSFQQIANLWTQNGGNPAWADTMAAIAIGGESGGDPTAKNAQSGAEGLFQILSSAQSPAFNAAHPPSTMSDAVDNVKAAIALLGDGSGISNWSADPIGAAIVANGSQPLSTQQAQQYAANPPIQATLMADVKTTATPSTTSTPAPVATDQLSTLGTTGAIGNSVAPTADAGSNVTNFHGYDLSAIPQDQIKAAETAIQQYLVNPGYAAQVNQKIATDFGYSGSWIQKIPQLNGILIWAATSLDPTSAADQNLVAGAVEKTQWWQQSDQNQRAWDEEQSQDPSTAANDLQQAQEKVLATANQVVGPGVLSKSQILQIANMYAAQSFTQSGVLGSESGTSQEWLDSAVVDSALNVKASGTVTSTGKAVNLDYAGNKTDVSSTTNPTQLGGIAQTLYQSLLGVAQNYLLYDPTNPTGGLLTTQDIMTTVDKDMQGYTGTGSSGLVSEFVSNATNQFTEQAKAQASSLYPTLASAIAAGSQPSTYIAPTANYVAQQLGMSSGSINVLDPQWNWIISSPGANGVLGPVTQDQALQKITNPSFKWTDPNGQVMSYDQTNNAVNNAHAVASSLAQMFGVGGL